MIRQARNKGIAPRSLAREEDNDVRRKSPRDRPSSIGLTLYPYLLNTKDSGVFLVGCCT